MIRAIWAQDENGLVGVDGTLPWHNPTDLAWFKSQTEGHVVVMGYKTAQSLPIFPLPNRTNIVIAKGVQGIVPDNGYYVVSDFESILNLYQNQDMWILGGPATWERLLPYVQEIYVTRMDFSVDVEGHDDAVYAPVLPADFIATEYIHLDDTDIKDVVKYERLA